MTNVNHYINHTINPVLFIVNLISFVGWNMSEKMTIIFLIVLAIMCPTHAQCK